MSNGMFLESKDFGVCCSAVHRVGTQKVFTLLFIVKECCSQEIDLFIFIQIMFTEPLQFDRHEAKRCRRISASRRICSS